MSLSDLNQNFLINGVFLVDPLFDTGYKQR